MASSEGKREQLSLAWQQSSGWGAILFIGYVVAVVLPVLLTVIAAPEGFGFVLDLALACGMVGFAILALQVVLAARFRWLDGPFGLDIVMQFHAREAMLAALLLLSHPILLMVAFGNTRLLSFQTSWQVGLGKAALTLLVLGVLFALLFSKLRIDYNLWRVMHKGMVVVVVLGFIHGLVIGPSLQRPAMRVYWWALLVVAGGIFIYRNVIVPLWVRRHFTITDVQQASDNTYTLTFEPVNGKPTPRLPGQFMFVKFIRPGRLSEAHPFTISASPLQTRVLQATIKQSGNFTDTIGQTEIGDGARIEAPFGRFSLVGVPCEKLVFIAGGVGITPLMSMLRYLKETGDARPVLLICGNKTERDILFRDEISALPDHVEVVHILSRPDESWHGARGRITEEVLSQRAGSLLSESRTHVFVCGPSPMMSSILRSLRALGVPNSRIHFERFTI